MRVMIVGSGAREHALGWALARSPSVTTLISLPGNPGLARLGECRPGAATDIDRVVEVARAEKMDLVVIGPEAPLAAGLADRLREAGIAAFGPSGDAARIESSKIFAREFMQRHRIPGARFEVFDDANAAFAHLLHSTYPCVVKADGLAAGKGAIVCRDRTEAEDAVRRLLLDLELGEAGQRILIEEFLRGEEVSVFALTDGHRVVALLPSQDHKAVRDGDEGPNTGGMGAYAPWPRGDERFLKAVEETILSPTVHGLAAEGTPFRGCLYAGLMVTEDGPKVVEFNCRFGDPETEAVLPLLDEDLAPLLAACAGGRLDPRPLRWRAGAALTVVLASGGYPGRYETGRVITGVDEISTGAGADSNSESTEGQGVIVFHAGTRREGKRLVTAGGRVLAVTAVGRDLAGARSRAYAAAERIHFDGVHMRRDIGARGLTHVGR